MLALAGPALAEGTVPKWRQALPGTAAFLGDDGGSDDTATVCDTVEHYIDWLDFAVGDNLPATCKRFPRGLPVIIEGVSFDPARDGTPGSTIAMPKVKIRIPSRGNFEGYLQLLGGIHPVIPRGTKGQSGADNLNASVDSPLDSGPAIAAGTTVEIIRRDASTGGLFVKVSSGPLTGRTGWIWGNVDIDGVPADMFDQAVVELPHVAGQLQRRPVTDGKVGDEWPGANGWLIRIDTVRSSDPDCMLAKTYQDHTLALVWNDVTDLWLIFVDKNFAAANNENSREPNEFERARFVVSVDGAPIIDITDFREVATLPSGDRVAVMKPRFIAWDKNNPGHDTGLETGQIFDAMRHGRTLKIETYGATNTDDLAGVGAALDHFQDCFLLQRRLAAQ